MPFDWGAALADVEAACRVRGTEEEAQGVSYGTAVPNPHRLGPFLRGGKKAGMLASAPVRNADPPSGGMTGGSDD
jgi:hypothetical protein